MKKIFAIILVLIFVLSACSENIFVGDIYAYNSGENCYIICDGKENLNGFYVTDETELIWKDTKYIPDAEMESENWEKWQWDWLGFCKIEVAAGKKAEPLEDTIGFEDVTGWYYAEKITVLEMYYEEPVEKPVIYLYPEKETEVSVNLDFSGKLTATYPEYNGGWKVTAMPDGTLFDESGREYYCLYWEGVSDAEYDFEEGFCIPGDKTAEFLETALPKLGLSPKEANEFIIYWLPKMQENEYNLISFQSEAYAETAKLEIVPKPDTLIRVFMAWEPLDKPIEIKPQELSAPERKGFVAVEWGGAEIRQQVENFLQASEKRRVDPGIFGENQE